MATHKILIENGMTNVVDADLNGLALSFINSTGGVVGTNDYTVLQNGATPTNPTGGSPNMQVTVWQGRSWVPNVTTPATNMYGTYLDSSINVTVGSNSSGQPRIDYLVLWLNLAAVGGSGTAVPQLSDIQGTPSASPVAPTTAQIQAVTGATNPYLILAQIGQFPTYIPNGVTSITSSMISSLRSFAFFTTGQTIKVPQFIDFTDQSTAPANPSSGQTNLLTIGSNLWLQKPTGPITQVGSTSIVSNGNSGSTPSIDWTQGSEQAFTFNAANIVFSFSNPTGGGKYLLYLQQDGTGSRTVAPNGWPNVVWAFGVAPTLSTTPNNIDIIGLLWNSLTNQYLGFYQVGFA